MESMALIKNKIILITGASGFVGSHLVDDLVVENTVLAIVRSTDPISFFSKQKLSKKCVMIKCDIQNTATIRHYINKYNVTHVFHLAAQPFVTNALLAPAYTYRTNILGTVSVLEACRQSPSIQSIVIATTDKVYGELTTDAYLENDPLQPTQPYDVSKACADLIGRSYAQTYQMPVAIVRAGNTYGEGDVSFDRIIPAIMKAVVTGTTLSLRSNGSHLRNYIYVKDVTSAYTLIGLHINKTRGQAYNVGSNQEMSVVDLISEIESALDTKIPYTIEDKAKCELISQALDSSKLKKALAWQPRYDIATVARQLLAYYQSVL